MGEMSVKDLIQRQPHVEQILVPSTVCGEHGENGESAQHFAVRVLGIDNGYMQSWLNTEVKSVQENRLITRPVMFWKRQGIKLLNKKLQLKTLRNNLKKKNLLIV